MVLKLTGQIKATATVIAIGTGLMFTNSASAGDVALKSTDGLINLSGEFVEFIDDTYILRTPTGELHISAQRVHCEGYYCPQFDAASVDVKTTVTDES